MSYEQENLEHGPEDHQNLPDGFLQAVEPLALRQFGGIIAGTAILLGVIGVVFSVLFWNRTDIRQSMGTIAPTNGVVEIYLHSSDEKAEPWGVASIYFYGLSAALFGSFGYWFLFMRYYRRTIKLLSDKAKAPPVCSICNREANRYWGPQEQVKEQTDPYEQFFQEKYRASADGKRSRNARYVFLGRSADWATKRLQGCPKKLTPKTNCFIFCNPWEDRHQLALHEFLKLTGSITEDAPEFLRKYQKELCQSWRRLISLRPNNDAHAGNARRAKRKDEVVVQFEVVLFSAPVFTRVELLDTGVFVGPYCSKIELGERSYFPSRFSEYSHQKATLDAITRASKQIPEPAKPENYGGNVRLFDWETPEEKLDKLWARFRELCKVRGTNCDHCHVDDRAPGEQAPSLERR